MSAALGNRANMDSKSISYVTSDIPAAAARSSITNISIVPVTEDLDVEAEKPSPTSSTDITEAELGLPAGLMVPDTGFEGGELIPAPRPNSP